MSKLTIEDKIKIIQLHKEGYTSRIIAKEIKVCHSRITEIISKYNLYGEPALEITHKKRKFTIEFKIDLITKVLNGESIHSVANENMISPGQLTNWVKKYKELGYNGLSEKPKGRPKIMKPETKSIIPTSEDEKDKRIRELEERNAQLEMENDLLKKLKALVQQRTQQQNKKK